MFFFNIRDASWDSLVSPVQSLSHVFSQQQFRASLSKYPNLFHILKLLRPSPLQALQNFAAGWRNHNILSHGWCLCITMQIPEQNRWTIYERMWPQHWEFKQSWNPICFLINSSPDRLLLNCYETLQHRCLNLLNSAAWVFQCILNINLPVLKRPLNSHFPEQLLLWSSPLCHFSKVSLLQNYHWQA